MKPVSPVLAEAISNAQAACSSAWRRAPAPAAAGDQHAAVAGRLQQRKQALKQAATTPVERATIEIVA